MMSKLPGWNVFYKIGGLAALSAVLVGLLEIVITFLPGGNVTQETVLDWFTLFQTNWFLGLRNLGLLNIFLDLSAVLIFLALYAAQRDTPYQPYAALAMIIAFVGIGVFFATNRAFPMLALSRQYAAATTEADRAALLAAGQSMLAVGQSHTAGTFLAFALVEAAGVLISGVMLRSAVFNRLTASAGLVGFALLLVFEFLASFVLGLGLATMILAMLGGLASLLWYILIARRLFQLGQAG